MNDLKNELTVRQTVFITAMMLLGRLSAASESGVGRDIWMVFLILPFLALPFIRIFLELSKRSPDIRLCFSSFCGKGLSYLFIFILCVTSVSIGALSISLFSTFLSATPMEHNCVIQSVILMTATYVILLSVPLYSIGRALTVLFPVTAFVILITVISSFGQMDLKELFPFFEAGIIPLEKGVFSAMMLQVAPLFYLPFLSGNIKKPKSFYAGLFCACALLLLSHIRNVAILGFPEVSKYRFPNYIAMSQVSLGDLFLGMEVLMTFVFVICQPVKAAICLRFTQNALSSFFPKTRKIWKFLLPLVCGILLFAGYNRTNLSDKFVLIFTGAPILIISLISFALLKIKEIKESRVSSM